MFRFIIRTIISLVVLFIISCSKDENPTNPPNTPSNHYYPLKVGNTWIYKNIDTNDIDTITFVMTDIASTGETAYVIDNQHQDDYTFGVRRLYYKEGLLYGYENQNTPEVVFDESLVSDTTYSIGVPAGTFNVHRYRLPGTDLTYWLAKGLGLIKLEGMGTRVLISYSIK